MKNLFKSIRGSILLTAIASVILGFVVLIYPDTSMTIVCRIVGGIVLLTGVGFVVGCLQNEKKTVLSKIGIFLGVLFLIVGGFILLFPKKIVDIVPVVFGALLIYHGIVNFKQAWELRLYEDQSWWIPALIAASIVLLGILAIKNPFDSLNVLMKVVSVCLIYDGLSSVVLVGRYARTIKKHPRLPEEGNHKVGELEVLEGDYKEL